MYKRINFALLILIFTLGINLVRADEGCFVKLTLEEKIEGIKLINVESIYGNYEGFVPVGEGSYKFKFYSGDYIKDYGVSTQLLLSEGLGLLNRSILEVVIPYKNYSKLDIYLGDDFSSFDLSEYNYECKRNCKIEGEFVDFRNGQLCCEEFYPIYKNNIYLCVSEKTYLDSYFEEKSMPQNVFFRYWYYFALGALILLVLIFLIIWKRRAKSSSYSKQYA